MEMMRNYAKHLGVSLLALACGGLWGAPAGAQQSTTTPGQTTRQAMDQSMTGETGMPGSRLAVSLPAGVTEKKARGTDGIHDVFKTVTQAVVAGDWSKVRAQLADADRNRLGSGFDDMGKTQLAPTVDQLRHQFEAKYNTHFDIDRVNWVYGAPYSYVTQGEISDPAQVTNWPLPATSQMASTQTGNPPENASRADKIDRGRDVAIVVIPPSRPGQPELTVSMIHQAPDFWKIDIPDNIDPAALTASLSRHLTGAAQMYYQWPTEKNDAYRDLTRQVLEALYDVPTSGGPSGPAGAMMQPGATTPGGMPGMSTTPGSSSMPGSTGSPSTPGATGAPSVPGSTGGPNTPGSTGGMSGPSGSGASGSSGMSGQPGQ